MPNVTIYGASDDLIEFRGAVEEEFNVPGKWRGQLLAPNGDSLTIYAQFGALGPHHADWTVGVQNTTTYPGWPIYFGERPDYEGDPALIIDVPEGTVVFSYDDNA